jgi:putative transposase
MKKAFKYRLSPNKQTEKQLYFVLNRCRELYNAGLSERKDSYQQYQRMTVMEGAECTVAATMIAGQVIKPMSFYGQKRDLVEIKEERPEYREIASHVLQDVLNRLDKAFSAFFRRVQNGETPGYPRFKGRDRYNSFTYPDGAGWKLDGDRIILTKIGNIKIKLHRPLDGKIKTVTIKREVDQWFVVFSCEIPEPQKLPLSYEDVGIDLGVTHLATLSNGETIEHPRYYRHAQKTLEKRQQALSRKKKGSHRRNKAKKLIGRAHKKIRNQRQDCLHKQSRKLVDRYQVLVFEDLQVANMVKRPKPKQDEQGTYLPNGAAAKGGLNKSIQDAGWGMFVAMCTSKAAEAGRTIIKVDPYKTSQNCSGCGRIVKKDLSERVHACPHCGLVLDRDENAAMNILRLGTSPHRKVSKPPRRAGR